MNDLAHKERVAQRSAQVSSTADKAGPSKPQEEKREAPVGSKASIVRSFTEAQNAVIEELITEHIKIGDEYEALQMKLFDAGVDCDGWNLMDAIDR